MGLSREKFHRLLALYHSGDIGAAAKTANAALRATPKDPNLLHLAAQIASATGDQARAIMYYRRALTAHPGWLEAEFNLANALHKNGQTSEAISLMLKVSQKRPDMPQVWESLARFHQAIGELPEAIMHWEKTLTLMPENHEGIAQLLLLKRQMCLWDAKTPSFDNLPPQAVAVLCDDPATQKTAAVRYAKNKFGSITPLPSPTWQTHQRLRIGYLSADFHAHATAYLMAELFELHDRKRFEVFAYSYGLDDRSTVRARLKQHAEHFVELNDLTALQAAVRIQEDEIDVLVDLKGYTRGSRLEILASRPAPVQIHWLGYPGTLGTTFIDYFVGDNVTIPRKMESLFTEKIIRLPGCYQINDRRRIIAKPLPREAYGLPKKAFVFASFNQTYKITPSIFALWCTILREAPEAVLWLYQSNPYAPDYLRKAAKEHGVDPMRLIFAPPLPLDQHLARYAHVDLALDTHPVGGHTTTSDALWTGTPVVSMVGKSFVARVATSILTAAKLPYLVSSNEDDYKKLVLTYFINRKNLLDLKSWLISSRPSLPIFETEGFVRSWEEIILQLSNPTEQ